MNNLTGISENIQNFAGVLDGNLADTTFNTINTQNLNHNISKDLNCSKIEKVPSEVGNSTISNVYNLAQVELAGGEDKENYCTVNSKEDIKAPEEEPKYHHFKNKAVR